MRKEKHLNYIQSSNLIFVAAALAIVRVFFSEDALSNSTNIAIEVVSISLIFGLGIVIRQGFVWVKYLLLVLIILGVIGMLFIPGDKVENPIARVLNILQTIVQIWAIILLFKIPKSFRKIDVELE